jgi:hypothetical protein
MPARRADRRIENNASEAQTSTLCRIGALPMTEWRHVDFEAATWFERQKKRGATSRQRPFEQGHQPFTHTTCFNVCTTSTRSRCASITASMSL